MNINQIPSVSVIVVIGGRPVTITDNCADIFSLNIFTPIIFHRKKRKY